MRADRKSGRAVGEERFPFMKATIAATAAAALLLLHVPALRAQQQQQQQPSSEALVKTGDAFDQKFQPTEALKYYLPAEKQDPKDVRLLTRIARQYRHLMSDVSAKAEKLRLGRISLDYAQRAAALAPNDAEAQLSPAISLGKMLPLMGSKEQVDASPRIRTAVDRTLRLDPRNDLAWHILGRWNRVLADVSGVKRALAGMVLRRFAAGLERRSRARPAQSHRDQSRPADAPHRTRARLRADGPERRRAARHQQRPGDVEHRIGTTPRRNRWDAKRWRSCADACQPACGGGRPDGRSASPPPM